MKHTYWLLAILTCYFTALNAQQIDYSLNDTIIKQLPDTIEVIGLGDPTHQESTITNYRIDLIKKLVEEKGFSIIAIEGNTFELHRAHINFLSDGNIAHYERAMYRGLNAEEMEALYHFVYQENKAGNPIQIVGFDTDFSGTTFPYEASKMLETTNLLTIKEREEMRSLLQKASNSSITSIFYNRNKIRKQLHFYATKITQELQPKNLEEQFLWQAMNTISFLFNDSTVIDKRDVGMGRNIAFIQKTFPKEKIILFGSSTHLIKNPKSIQTSFFQNIRETTLGHELHKAIGRNYYFIAYSAISGTRSNLRNKPIPIEALNENAIEFIQSKQMNKSDAFLSIENTPTIEMTQSRFMGHSFVPLNLWEVMDGLVLISNVKPFKIKETTTN